jgi:Fic family protein
MNEDPAPVNRGEQAQAEKLLNLAECWTASLPLKSDAERRLWKKLRLDWNYNSNHIEGNTLTYGETELLLLHGQTQGRHELREYEEMKAHDVAITRLRELAGEKRPLTEAEIRTWNGIILKEPFWKDAITPAGEPTRKQIVPGQYKSTPNSVRTATGEIFDFATPIDVPAKMEELVLKLNAGLSCPLPELPSLLAETHHQFLLIHPFDDGNGRVGRLILNYILLYRELVPIIIPSSEKKTYLQVLREADAGVGTGLADFIRTRMIIALEEAIENP